MPDISGEKVSNAALRRLANTIAAIEEEPQ